MPDVRPFKALFFDPAKAGAIEKNVSEPYDKVSDNMRESYLKGSPYNIARVDLPRERVDADDKYATAAKVYRGWIQKGVVRRAPKTAFYVYEQGFDLPGEARYLRRAFVGLVEAREHSIGNVLPHERTFREPKADRMALLEAVRAHFGMCFLLYQDPEKEVERALTMVDLPQAKAIFDFRLTDGTTHRLIAIEDNAAILAIRKALFERTCVIADGHHRYETAIAFRRDHEAKGDVRPGYAYRTAAFVDIADPGLRILPTHRLMPKEIGVDRFVQAAAPWLAPARGADAARFTVTDGQTAVHLERKAGLDLAKDLPEVPAAVRELDVTILHKLVLEKGLGIEAGAKEHSVGYVRWPNEGKIKIAAGEYGSMVVLRGTSPADVLAVAESGAVMPQKSTDFYPKLLSGLVMNDIEDDLYGG
jgi:uncharacterized protein (DUF1015 family)